METQSHNEHSHEVGPHEAGPLFTKENTLFRKKPVSVHAVQWHGPGFIEDVKRWVESFGDNYDTWFAGESPLTVKTLESAGGYHTASIGDFIIRGIKSEYYPCKPDIFALNYERV